MQRRYAILDVFADTPLAGNPLAVVLDAEGIDDARMQAIAKEFNLSETVFVLPPAGPSHHARVRIFTPIYELPFAGHPTVGTAVLLASEFAGEAAAGQDSVLVLDEKVGPVRCAVALKSASLGHAIFDVPRLAAPVPAALDREALAAALGLLPSEIGFENHAPAAYSAGVPYIFVPVRDLAAIGRSGPVQGAWDRGVPKAVADSVFVYTREVTAQGRQFHARMFWPSAGIVEDPATGSAAAAFAGVVLAFDRPPSGTHHLTIEQGFEMGRPSLIRLEIDVEAGRLAGARIGGDAVVIARGTLTL